MKIGAVSASLSVLVLAGAWGSLWLNLPLWVALALAAFVGMLAGCVAPRRLPAWLAWCVLVLLAWAFYAAAAVSSYGFPHPQVISFVVYPLASSIGVLAGLLLRRVGASGLTWRAASVASAAILVAGLVLLHAPLLAWGNPGSYPAPAFVLRQADGTTESAQALRGKTVVLAFWATWCGPCLHEVPALDAMYWRYYAHRSDVRFVLVDEDEGTRAAPKVATWLAAHHITMPSVLDPDGAIQRGFRTYGIVPTRVVISPSGRVVLTQLGYSGADATFIALRKGIDQAAQ